MGQKLENAKSLYLEGIRDGKAREAVTKYTGDRYTQHSTGVKDGQEGFIEFFTDFIARNPERRIDIVRGWEDGRYVFLQAYQNLGNGDAEWVTTDFFDTDDNGKIIEHWDVISPFAGPNSSGRTQVDGSTEITDLDSTEQNKIVVGDLITNALMTGARTGRIEEFTASEYLSHTTEEADGPDHFKALNYDEIVLLVGQGNFVATLCKANREGTPLAQVDIFRLDGGKIVEHWDNSEPVPENDVNSGKF